MKSKILKILGIGLLLWCIYHWEVLFYGASQAKGQIEIIANTIPIEEVLKDTSVADSIKRKIELIQEIKRFTVNELGFKETKSYTSYYNQNNKPILWVLTASPKFKIEAKVWNFPVLGEFPYKGFFDKDLLEKEIAKLDTLNQDYRVGEVNAWSTLGILNDPVLSGMLNKNEANLAALIIHELSHSTLFVKGNLAFNENLADFVGDNGAKLYLEQKYGDGNTLYTDYKNQLENQKKYSNVIINGAQELDSLYSTFSDKQNRSVKLELKEQLIQNILLTASDSLNLSKPIQSNTVNNAYFVAFKTYQEYQNDFKDEFETKFNSNFKKYLGYLKKKYKK